MPHHPRATPIPDRHSKSPSFGVMALCAGLLAMILLGGLVWVAVVFGVGTVEQSTASNDKDNEVRKDEPTTQPQAPTPKTPPQQQPKITKPSAKPTPKPPIVAKWDDRLKPKTKKPDVKKPPEKKEIGLLPLISEEVVGGLKVKLIRSETTTLMKNNQPVRLAVSRPHYDDMGKLLKQLGKGYQYTTLDQYDFLKPAKLLEFDVIFLTCDIGNTNPRMFAALREFVGKGGTLYASDLRFDALHRSFPEYNLPGNVKLRQGLGEQDVVANVVDDGLRQVLGSTIKLRFKDFGWRPASFDPRRVTIFLEGNYKVSAAGFARAPLLVKFKFGEGTVIYTAFHNEAQNSADEIKLLKHLVFAAVTSKLETTLTKTMISGGFSPRQIRQIGVSRANPQASTLYRCKKAGPLKFSLGFRGKDAKLRLTLKSPEGQQIVREGTGTFSVEIDNAPAGVWRCTGTALAVPYKNFPFTLTIGERR